MSDRSTILVNVHGPDHPGISAGLMDVLTATNAEVYDIEQIVVRGQLTLNVLIGVDGRRPPSGTCFFSGGSRGCKSSSRWSTRSRLR
jgi:hypothetical protein